MNRISRALLRIGPLVVGALAGPVVVAAEGVAKVDAFVCRNYLHGVPYQGARAFSGADVDRLIELLKDPAQESYWHNAIVTLGIVGEDRVTPVLVDFVEKRFRGPVTLHQFNALLSVPLALGHAGMRGNKSAVDYLLAHASVAAWDRAGLEWSFQKYGGERRSVLLTKMVIRGLAFSCTESAKSMLVKMRDSNDAEATALRAHALDDIRESLAFYEELLVKGPEKTFVYTEPEPVTKPSSTTRPSASSPTRLSPER